MIGTAALAATGHRCASAESLILIFVTYSARDFDRVESTWSEVLSLHAASACAHGACSCCSGK